MTYEFVYITIEYQCGCVVIRPELVARVSIWERREDFCCPHHSALHTSRTEMVREREREPVTQDTQWPPVGREVEAS